MYSVPVSNSEPTKANIRKRHCIHQLIQAQAKRTPDAPAVRFEETTLTYRDLDMRSTQLARYLRRLGVTNETIVAICLDRSVEVIVAMLGVLKAGGAYVPIDPRDPQARSQLILNDTESPLLISVSRLVSQFQGYSGRFVALDVEANRIGQESRQTFVSDVQPDDLAYIIYTSGSTGTPKGAMIEHHSIVNIVRAQQQIMALDSDCIFLQSASYSFDFAAAEIYVALVAGACLCIAPNHIRQDPLALFHFMEANRISAAVLTPTVLSSFPEGELPSLNVLVAAGEPVNDELIARWAQNRRFVNGYGPTECTIIASFHKFTPHDTANRIGRPIPGVNYYILDEQQKPVRRGQPGELYIGGRAVGRGYLNRPALTAERFCRDRFVTDSNGRMYRTGDLVRELPDNSVEYLGRIDNQIKLRGFRIELGEIEVALQRHGDVREAVVAVKRDRHGDKRLVAYVAPMPEKSDCVGPEARREEILDSVKEVLPHYMVPSALVYLDRFPTLANGKLARADLPDPDWSLDVVRQPFAPPRTETERELVGMWCTTLGLDRVGIYDEFLQIGGHSLKAVMLAMQVQERWGLAVSGVDVLEHPTIERLAGKIDDLRQRGGNGHWNTRRQLPCPVAAAETARGPLSSAQQEIWFTCKKDLASTAYNIGFAFDIEGPLDADRFARALNLVVSNHQILQTSFHEDVKGPFQRVHSHRSVAIRAIDVNSTEFNSADLSYARDEDRDGDREARIRDIIAAESNHRFDLEGEVLLRCLLIKVTETTSILLFVTHHLVFDGRSLNVFTQQLFATYEALRLDTNPKLSSRHQYLDYVRWHQLCDQDPAYSEDLGFWTDHLREASPYANLPRDKQTPGDAGNRGARVSICLERRVAARVRQLAAAADTTPYCVLLAAYAVFLHRHTGSDDLAVGIFHGGRNHPDILELIGMFVGTAALRFELSAALRFDELVAESSHRVRQALRHHRVPFAHIVKELAPAHAVESSPYTGASFVFQEESSPIASEELTICPRTVYNGTYKFDLLLELRPERDQFTGWFEFNASRFDEGLMHMRARSFEQLLESLVEHPEKPVADAEYLAPQAQQLLLADPQPSHSVGIECLHQRFEQMARQFPAATALTCEGSAITYSELNRRANQMARYLAQQGVDAGALVGLCMEPSIELIISILAVLKLGCGYVPLDPAYPHSRLNFMSMDADVAVIIGDETAVAAIAPHVPSLCLATSWDAICRQHHDDLNREIALETTAYVIYTSGSTGQPKGVPINHGNVMRLFTATEELFDFGYGDVWALVHSVSFDFSVWEIWGALLYGGRLVVVPTQKRKSIQELHELVVNEQVSVLNQTFTAFSRFVACNAVAPVRELPWLRYVIFGGEAVDPPSLRSWYEYHGDRIKLVNMYGITETTVHVTYKLLSAADTLSSCSNIGRPISDLTIYLLDKERKPVPWGTTGEVYVAGPGLAEGYLNRPEMTRERFIDNPYSSYHDGKLYRTGDLARKLPSGDFVYLGRCDEQVQLHGHRIELEEVESALRNLPGIDAAAVALRRAPSGDECLVGYFTASADLSVHRIKDELGKLLPAYMVPTLWVHLPELPLTASGKLDRSGLPEFAAEHLSAESRYIAPTTDLEAQIAAIWSDVLGVEAVSLDDDFFALGGYSLLATKLLLQTKHHLNAQLTLAALYANPVLRDYCRAVKDFLNGYATASVPCAALDLDAEAQPSFDLSVAGKPVTDFCNPSTIFLTGATGFVGSFLLPELLRATSATVICLARAGSDEAATERIRNSLRQYGLDDTVDWSRIVGLAGDLSQPNLGLSDEAFGRLAREIDVIFHSAAWVNFTEPYYRLKSVNVRGMETILRLATLQRSIPIQHMSSSAVYEGVGYLKDRKYIYEDDSLDLSKDCVILGYSKSKWVAERMLENAKSLGVKANIFRLELVMGHSMTGVTSLDEFPSRLIKSCLQMKAFPRLDTKLAYFLPVDYAVQAITKLALNGDLGKRYNVVNPEPIGFSEFGNLLLELGYEFELLPFRTWTATLARDVERSPENPLYPLLNLHTDEVPGSHLTVPEHYLKHAIFDCRNVFAGLEGTGITCPAQDRDMFRIWMDYLVQCGFIEAPTDRGAESD